MKSLGVTLNQSQLSNDHGMCEPVRQSNSIFSLEHKIRNTRFMGIFFAYHLTCYLWTLLVLALI